MTLISIIEITLLATILSVFLIPLERILKKFGVSYSEGEHIPSIKLSFLYLSLFFMRWYGRSCTNANMGRYASLVKASSL